MGNDLMSALVELITNSDDSYSRLGGLGPHEIRVVVDRKRRIVTVEDDAEGMTPEQLEDYIGVLGGQTSGFNDHDGVRGFFGRGAKDVPALGDTTWITYRDGLRTDLTIRLDLDDDEPVEIAEPIQARHDLHGTRVELSLRKKVNLPRFSTLVKLLSRHYALRPLMLDSTRRLLVTDGKTQERVSYAAPEGKALLEGRRRPLCQGSDHQIRVTLSQADEPLGVDDSGKLGQQAYWRHSLLVTSGRAAYEIWPGGEFAKPPDSSYLMRLYGQADVPVINDMLRESELVRGAEEIVDRNRKGLVRGADQSFVAMLDKSIADAVRPYMERLRREAERSSADYESTETKRMLSRLAGELQKYIQEELEEPPDERLAGSVIEGLQIIPAARHVPPMQPASVVVRYQAASVPEWPPVAVVRVQDEWHRPAVTELPLQLRGDYCSATLKLDGREDGSIVEVVAELPGREARAMIMWEVRDVPIVEELKWEYDRYSMKPGGVRNCRLLGPVDVLGVVPTVGFAGKTELEMEAVDRAFEWDAARECCVYRLRVSGDVDGLHGVLLGSVEDTHVLADVRTRLPGLAGMKIVISEEHGDARERAWYVSSTQELIVNAKHAEVARYLGPALPDHRPGQHSLPFRTMLRELVCHAVVSHTLQESQSELREPSQVLGAYEREYERLIARTRAILVPDAVP